MRKQTLLLALTVLFLPDSAAVNGQARHGRPSIRRGAFSGAGWIMHSMAKSSAQTGAPCKSPRGPSKRGVGLFPRSLWSEDFASRLRNDTESDSARLHGHPFLLNWKEEGFVLTDHLLVVRFCHKRVDWGTIGASFYEQTDDEYFEFPLPFGVHKSDISAKLDEGALTVSVRLPKESLVRTDKIKIA
uniref:SHSP domain-containing protein n=1 Tax=Hemiselmis andersenii TaxID=464988 RepID=A0A6U4V5M9_HEMAN|mmetsp:Transcript_26317/g.63833  ORF Transcript_26317/g.63833 Transcript_26317/m.63833 type:complete len:187 (-) Transcript_26317:344-904(-)